jgi:glycosyltransferase involved in cell wall biosynthesis
MKIAMTTTLLPVTHYSVSLLQALQRSDTETVIYANRDPENLSVPLENVRLVWSSNFMYPWHILSAVIKDRPDIVHLQHEFNMYGGKTGAALFPLLLFLLRMLGKRTIVTVHAVIDTREVDARFSRTFSWSDNPLALRVTRIVLEVIYRAIAKLSTATITHTQGLRELLVTRYGADPQTAHVIPIGVSSPSLEHKDVSAHRFGLQEGQDFILCFGYIVRRKGLEHLIETFEKIHGDYPDCKLILAGAARDPDYLVELQDWVQTHGIEEQILFPGFMTESEISWLFSHARFSVFTYQYSVSASHPLTFAIAHHCPAIAPSMGIFQEEITEGVNGLLVPPEDETALSSAMRRLLEDDLLRERLAEGMVEQRQERDWAQVALQTVKAYNQALSD